MSHWVDLIREVGNTREERVFVGDVKVRWFASCPLLKAVNSLLELDIFSVI